MFDLFLQSVTLFLKGKLFQNPGQVVRQAVLGMIITALLCVALVKVLDRLWLAVPVSALLGGMLQPFLFKNLKYN